MPGNLAEALEVRPGDVVVFFAADRMHDRTPARYWFIGFAKVERKVAQTAIRNDDHLRTYREYSNLLIRPGDEKSFSHYEPFERRLWHRDWLWRIAEKSGHRKRAFATLERRGWFDAQSRVARRPLRIAANYVLLESENAGTFVAAEPPEVGLARRNSFSETWHRDELSNGLRTLVFPHTHRRGLRTTNPQQAHRHIRLNTDAAAWIDAARSLVSSFNLRPR